MNVRHPSGGSSSGCAVSVVIPVLDDAERLRTCLDALAHQDLEASFEVVVVDNGSRDAPEAVVSQYSWARLIREDRPSSYAARNAGARHAVGTVLAFTDSDCIPSPSWLSAGCACLSASAGPAFVGGRVEVFAAADRPSTVELFDIAQGFPQSVYIARHGFAVTANLLTTRETFEAVGPFSDQLVSSGDREWGQRASAAGVAAIYSSEAAVRHPARARLEDHRRKIRRLQRGEAQLRRVTGQQLSPRQHLRLVVPPLRFFLRSSRAIGRPGARARYLLLALALHALRVYEHFRVVARGERAAVR